MAQREPDVEILLKQVRELELQADADLQLIAALQAQSHLDQAKITNLEIALNTARKIGAAVGILMATLKITQEQAFSRLSVTSQNSGRKLRDVAAEVLDTGALPNP